MTKKDQPKDSKTKRKEMTQKQVRYYTEQLFLLDDFLDGKVSKKKLNAKLFPYLIVELVGMLNDREFPTGDSYSNFREEFERIGRN